MRVPALDMLNKNTGDPNGDTSFVLSRRTTAYECRHGNANSFFCKGMTQFDGDDSNSTDLVQQWDIQIDGNCERRPAHATHSPRLGAPVSVSASAAACVPPLGVSVCVCLCVCSIVYSNRVESAGGPYLYCNPVNSSDPLGAWDCDVTISGGGSPTPITPPAQCAATNFSVYNDFCWVGYGGETSSTADAGGCCAAATKSHASHFTYFAGNKSCTVFRMAFNSRQCTGAVSGEQARGPAPPPTCNCSRVHQAVGRENLTVAMSGYKSSHPAGGLWYSFPAQGECSGSQNVGDNNCTWKVRRRCVFISESHRRLGDSPPPQPPDDPACTNTPHCTFSYFLLFKLIL
jgi:hypothetical protein